MVLGFEPRTLPAFHHLSHASALFAVVIFQVGSHFYAWACLHCNLPIYATCVAGMTGTDYRHELLYPAWILLKCRLIGLNEDLLNQILFSKLPGYLYCMCTPSSARSTALNQG
jgi:hypothetical protein